MKSICSLLCLAIALQGYSQSAASLVEAELAFARQSREENTRAAFLANLDSNGVIFNNGRVLNGVKFWQRAPAQGAKLLWTPSMSHTASAGDVGFTTGPYEVRDFIGGKVLGSGQFTSVWKLDGTGKWKLLADLGTSYVNNAFPGQVLTAVGELLIPATQPTSIDQLETSLLQALQAGSASVINRIATNGVLNFNGRQPLQAKDSVQQALALLQEARFSAFASGISQSNDLGYVYGQVKKGSATANYLRVWGHTARGWVVLVQVIDL
ncbi:MAG: hypothetical protein J7621_21545 [Niastella sp.]|nr:hypothetical protein [Niastella sp.]